MEGVIAPLIPPAASFSSDDDRQQKLQQQFAEQRRKDLLAMQTGKARRVAAQHGRGIDGISLKAKAKANKERPAHHLPRSVRRQRNREKRLKNAATTLAADGSEVVVATVDQAGDPTITSVVQLEPSTPQESGAAASATGQSDPESWKSEDKETKVEIGSVIENTSGEPLVSTPDARNSAEKPQISPKELKPKAQSKGSVSKRSASKVEKKSTPKDKNKAPTEAERKAQLANRLEAEVKKTRAPFRKIDSEAKYPLPSALSKHAVNDPGSETVRKVASTKRSPVDKISDVEGFNSLESAIGGKTTKAKTSIEKTDATKLEILRVYQLQDPRSRVFNFDPYLQKIMPVAEFDFNALKEYITSSRDEALKKIANEHNKRYVGSTSSMTGVLAHFHFLLSQWRPINATMLSKTFPTHLTSFTELQRAPSAIFLRWRDGSYAIDADKQFQNASVLSMLGKSMEKLLTLSTDDFERYRKSSQAQVSEDEQFAPESYHYSTMGDFLMRSQLDAHDPRLPGTGMFDLKTRAVVSIRMDVSNYEQGTGYQIKSRQGEWESYEREYYDMIRAAFLKYSMQVRMGRMDGIFVAFHNVERIFGFQYISLPEMDSTIHGQWDTSIGDQEFKLSLDLLNKALDKATAKFPETSIRLHFETREAQTPFMYIFAEPVTEEQVAEVQNANDAKIQEFERSILGLHRGDEAENGETQEDDGKWENIQADVQKEMDKDELSLDDPSENQEAVGTDEVDVEGNGGISEIQGILEEGPLYANKRSGGGLDDVNVSAAESQDGEEHGEDDAEGEVGTDEEDSRPERQEARELDRNFEESSESKDESRLESGDIASIASEVSSDGLTGESNGGGQVSDQPVMIASEDGLEAMGDAKQPDARESDGVHAGDIASTGNGKEPTPKPLSPKTLKKKAKQDYVPPIGEENSEFQSEADQPFLDAIDQDLQHVEEAADSKPDILAMTLTVRNKVNGQYTLRPERLTDQDKWSIEYSLNEVPTQRKARALYEACRLRRQKRMNKPLVPEDAETINFYLQNLRKLSRKGREWRQEQDKKDGEKPVRILGQEVARTEGDGDLVDQGPEA
ncbi:hypothetical protein P7C71_g5247, partial [Lecanoromycetidae sp. Uapishka_2]